MQRAAVLIGVSRSGQLRPLQAVKSGVERMRKWAEAQKFDRIDVLTDEKKPLRIQEIKDVIKEIVDATTCEQLIVYFAGHGVNIGKSERWLLSDAPGDTGAAVNVNGSELQARYCGIPHVVFISDACRTAAEGIQAGGVSGGDIFPNLAAGGKEKPVDIFWAAALGSPALEIKDPTRSADSYQAVYTESIADALNGLEADLMEPDSDQGLVIRPDPLKEHLDIEVPERIKRAAVRPNDIPEPDARITSRAKAWLARFPAPPPAPPPPPAPAPNPVFGGGGLEGAPDAGGGGGGGWGGPAIEDVNENLPVPKALKVPRAAPRTLSSVGKALVSEAIAGRAMNLEGAGSQGKILAGSIAAASQPFGPAHFETQCGFKVRGAEISEAYSSQPFDKQSSDVVSVKLGNQAATNVMIVFRNETSVVLPALQYHLTALNFEDGELTSVSYEPADTSGLYSEYDLRELRVLRSAIAAAARFGVFRLSGDDGLKLAQRIQYAKTKDPSMALYAAYAYHDLHQSERIGEMQGYFYNQFRVRFFDLALLTRSLDAPPPEIMPFCPMLAQGWAMLRAFGARVPEALKDAESDLVPSLWTVFGKSTTDRLRQAWKNGEVK